MLGLLVDLIMRTYHETRGRLAFVVRQVLVGGEPNAVPGERRPARTR